MARIMVLGPEPIPIEFQSAAFGLRPTGPVAIIQAGTYAKYHPVDPFLPRHLTSVLG